MADEPHEPGLDEAAGDPGAWVPGLLRVPGGMPGDVWAGLERSLLDEAARREASAPGDAPAASAAAGADLLDLDAARTRRRRLTRAGVGLAAAAALVVGGTVVATSDFLGGGTGPAPVAGPAPVSGPGGSGGSGMIVASGTDYDATTLGDQVQATFRSIRGTGAKAAGAEPGAMSASAADEPLGMPMMVPAATVATMAKTMPFLSSAVEFQGCLHQVVKVAATQDIKVLLVDLATMDGTTAVVVVIPAGEMPGAGSVDPDMEQAFALTATCRVVAQVQVDVEGS